ncbi:MAG: helicase HerA-like domain-containing protein [Cyclobacteriaceae bacterium]
MSKDKFIQSIQQSYSTSGATIYLGAGVLEGEILADAKVNLPLRMMNRHGLVTGATGSGKTRTLQLIAEQLSAAGVAVFMPDMKEISRASPKRVSNDRSVSGKGAGIQWSPGGFPVELYSLSGQVGCTDARYRDRVWARAAEQNS